MTKHTKIQKALLLKNIHEGLGGVGITTVTERLNPILCGWFTLSASRIHGTGYPFPGGYDELPGHFCV